MIPESILPTSTDDPSTRLFVRDHRKSLMHSAEVVKGELECQRQLVILPLLTDCIREPRYPPVLHPNRDIERTSRLLSCRTL